MSEYLCGGGPIIPEGIEIPASMEPWCCGGAAEVEDMHYCDCWVPVIEPATGQTPPDGTPASVARPSMCSDCAFRPGSPERANDESVTADTDDLERCVTTGVPFYCHDGMVRVLGWDHPSGVHVEAPVDAYTPPIRMGTPYRADGAPALLCAGWQARRARLRREPKYQRVLGAQS